MPLNTERNRISIRYVAAHHLHRLRAQRLQLRHQLGRARRLQPATRRQQQVTHPVTSNQMPRNLPAKLSHPARDQHRPTTIKTARLARRHTRSRSGTHQPWRHHRTMPQRQLRLRCRRQQLRQQCRLCRRRVHVHQLQPPIRMFRPRAPHQTPQRRSRQPGHSFLRPRRNRAARQPRHRRVVQPRFAQNPLQLDQRTCGIRMRGGQQALPPGSDRWSNTIPSR